MKWERANRIEDAANAAKKKSTNADKENWKQTTQTTESTATKQSIKKSA